MIRASRFHNGLDAAEGLTLRDAASGAETASGLTGENSVGLNRLNAYWQDSEPDSELYQVDFTVTAIDVSGGAVYSLIVFRSDTSGGTRTELGRIPRVNAVGTYSLTIDSDALGASANYIACGVEISAATPRSITYGATLKKTGTKVRKSRATAHDTPTINKAGAIKPRRTSK